jgi:hypothetical protein
MFGIASEFISAWVKRGRAIDLLFLLIPSPLVDLGLDKSSSSAHLLNSLFPPVRIFLKEGQQYLDLGRTLSFPLVVLLLFSSSLVHLFFLCSCGTKTLALTELSLNESSRDCCLRPLFHFSLNFVAIFIISLL